MRVLGVWGNADYLAWRAVNVYSTWRVVRACWLASIYASLQSELFVVPGHLQHRRPAVVTLQHTGGIPGFRRFPFPMLSGLRMHRPISPARSLQFRGGKCSNRGLNAIVTLP